jgi:predicted alpha/beta hydrolase family esterase
MRKVVIVHGCPSSEEQYLTPGEMTYDKHWIPWIRNELVAKGVKVETPAMPEPWAPDYEKFKSEFSKYEVDEETILVGHSCGAAFLVRWLGDTKRNVAMLILVAPWNTPDEDDQFRKMFYNYSIDQTIKSRVQEVVIFTANDEEDDGRESAKNFSQALGGRLIELEGRGHYTIGDMGTSEFPELLETILK